MSSKVKTSDSGSSHHEIAAFSLTIVSPFVLFVLENACHPAPNQKEFSDMNNAKSSLPLFWHKSGP